MEYPSISIVIICKDEERVIARCLCAIEKQISNRDEIIVVDIGSTDNTIKIIKEKFSNIKQMNYQWQDDFAEARNFGISCAKKDWIFFIDSDEILQPLGIENLRKDIFQLEKYCEEPVVFSPQVHNVNDSIVYNSGRIIKNNGEYKFYGCVHEYPIFLDDLTGMNYTPIKLPDVTMVHDGYNDEVVMDKDKPVKYSLLNKKMLEEFPESDRYQYFYYRDSKPLLSKEEYENGLKNFIEKFTESDFSEYAYNDLICHLILLEKTDEADIYLRRLWESLKLKEDASTTNVTYLAALNELQRISNTQKELLQTLEMVRANLAEDENRTIGNGFSFDDLISYLYWSLGDFSKAKEINAQLEKSGYFGMLHALFENNTLKGGD